MINTLIDGWRLTKVDAKWMAQHVGVDVANKEIRPRVIELIKDSLGFLVQAIQNDWRSVYFSVGVNLAERVGWQEGDLIACLRHENHPAYGRLIKVTGEQKQAMVKNDPTGCRSRIRVLSIHDKEVGKISQFRITYDYGDDLPTKEQWPCINNLTIVSIGLYCETNIGWIDFLWPVA